MAELFCKVKISCTVIIIVITPFTIFPGHGSIQVRDVKMKSEITVEQNTQWKKSHSLTHFPPSRKQNSQLSSYTFLLPRWKSIHIVFVKRATPRIVSLKPWHFYKISSTFVCYSHCTIAHHIKLSSPRPSLSSCILHFLSYTFDTVNYTPSFHALCHFPLLFMLIEFTYTTPSSLQHYFLSSNSSYYSHTILRLSISTAVILDITIQYLTTVR